MKNLFLTHLIGFLFFFSGISSAQECVPQFSDIYSFPIGSEFQYKTTSGGEYASEDVLIETYKITDIWENGDTLFYAREGTFDSKVYLLGFERMIDSHETGIINDTVCCVRTLATMLNACEDQLILIDQDKDYYSYVKIQNEEKTMGGEDNIYKMDGDNPVLIDPQETYGYHNIMIYKEGTGLVKESKGDIMSFTKRECEGYIIDGDTTGVFQNIALSANYILQEDKLVIFPNILQEDNRINISSTDRIKALHIVSLDGRIIREKQLNQDFLLLGDIPKGMYFLTFIFDDYRETRRVIKR